MKMNLKGSILAGIALAAGLIVLLGYFINLPMLSNIRLLLMDWALLLAAVALLVGLFNLVAVHWRKLRHRQANWFYSLALLIALFITLILGLVYHPTGAWPQWIFNNIQVPVEASLAALLAIVLAYAAARLFYRRLNFFSIVFVAVLLIVLIGMVTQPWVEIPELSDLRKWIEQVPAIAGARGLLLGVALGVIATGLRVLMGADRPYEG